MKRRQLLASVGSLGALSAAGCVGNDTADAGPDDREGDRTDDPSDDTTDDGTDSTTDTTDGDDGSDDTTDGDDGSNDTTDDGSRVSDDEPVETIPVGDREGVPFPDNNGPHGVTVVNDADARDLRVVLDRDGERVLDRVFELPAGRRVALTLNEPSEYEVGVGVDGRLVGTVAVERSRFDCNGSSTEVTVDADGQVDSTTVSTLVACPGPEVAGTEFEQGEGTCGGTDRATVAVDDERVNVSGAVGTPVPCYDLALSGVELEAEEYDGRNGTLVVTVTTAGRQDGACAECLGEVSYEATVELANAYPETVRVVHVGVSGEQVVAETTT